MRVFLEKTVTKHELTDICCNVCGRGINQDDSGYFEDHVTFSKSWGYHSPFDGESHAIDLCVECYQAWIRQFQIPPNVTEVVESAAEQRRTCEVVQ